MSSFEIVPYDASHRDAYVRLLGEAWGNRGLTADEFDWWFSRNPEGSIVHVALVEGEVAGASSHMLARMSIGVCSFACHAVTSPAAQGLGIFTALQRSLEEEATARGVQVVLGFGNEVTNPVFFGRLGWSDLAHYRIWGRPVLRRRPATPVVEPRVDGDAAAAWPNHIVRDERYLRWRFADSPRPYTEVRSANGYAVVWPAKPFGSRTIAVVSDLVAPAGETRGLLRSAARVAESRAIFALPAPEQRGAFAAAGFFPTPRTVHLIGRGLNGPLDPDPAAWRFTLGDADYY